MLKLQFKNFGTTHKSLIFKLTKYSSSFSKGSVPLMDTTNQTKNRIIGLLRDGGSLGREIFVVAIVGVGGSGKTTLNQILFNDARISSIFSFKAWISVGEVFDVLHITRSILMLSGCCSKENTCNDLEVLQRILFKSMAGKRFLIILEDIGTINLEASWDFLLLSLRSAAKGSFLIVISDNKEVTDIIHPVFTFHSLEPFVYAFFNSDSMTNLSEAQQDVFKKISCELDRLMDFYYAGVTKGKHKEVVSTGRFIKDARLSFSALKQLVNRSTYHSNIKGVREILDSITRDHAQFGSSVNALSANQTQAWSVQTAGSQIITDVVIGRDQGRDFIVSKLSDNSMTSNTLSIASIVGTGGAGNATLARYVYGDEMMKRCFDVQFWVSATQDFAFEVLMSHMEAIEGAMEFLTNFRDNVWQVIQQDSRLAHFWKTANFIGREDFWTRIEKLKQRRSLFIFELENVHTEADALAYNLQSEDYLDELVLEWSATSNDPVKARIALMALKPHPTLTRLTINNYQGTSLPNWVGDSAYCCLRSLQLFNCPNCNSLPSLGKLPSLVYLSINNFKRLEIIGQEFYGDLSSHHIAFESLKILHLEDLPKWQTWVAVKCECRAFPVLQELYLIECSQLVGKLPDELQSLTKLQILDCEQLNISLPQLPQLTSLTLQNCELVDLAILANLSSLISLDVSFEGENKTCVPNLEKLTSLSYLRIAGRHNICNFEEVQFPSALDTLFISYPVDLLNGPLSTSYDSAEVLPSLYALRCIPSSLTSLSIGGFKDLDLPKHSYMSLQYLSIHDCYLSEPLNFPLGDFLMLEYLEIKNCFHLESLDVSSAPSHEVSLPFLNELSIDNCPHLLNFTREGFTAPNLRTLSITNCKNLLSLPEGMHTHMTSLLSLSLTDCPDLDSFPEGGLPSSLQTLRIRYCKQLTTNWKQWNLQQLVSLTQLEIQGCEEVECFPPQDWLPASLTSLVIAHFPALAFLIGETFQQLSSLQELQIMYCQELLSLPEEMPPSLKYLGIYLCPLLKERCERDKGEDWPKISHLPRVTVDFQDI